MSILNLTHDELHKRLYKLSSLSETQRKTVFDLINKLNSSSNWYPDAFHRQMKELDETGVLSTFERKLVEKEFFPERHW